MSRLAGGRTPETVLGYLQGITFPVHKDDVVHAARRNGAPNDVVGTLQRLPKNEFANEQELIEVYPDLS